MSAKFNNKVQEKFYAEVQELWLKLSAIHSEMEALSDKYTDAEKEEILCNSLTNDDCIAWSDAQGKVEQAVERLGLHFS